MDTTETKFIFNSDQIGIPLVNLPKNTRKKIIKLVEDNGYHQDHSVGRYYLSINFKLKLWFEHTANEYYPDLPIKNVSNPFPEIERFFLEINRERNPRFIEGEIETTEQDEVNSRIMEFVSDELCEPEVEKKCAALGIQTYVKDGEGTSYTEQAQNIFNDLYDVLMTEVYAIANTIEGEVTADKLSAAYYAKQNTNN